MSNKTRKTALKGLIGNDWAVDGVWMKNAIQVLQGNRLEIPQRDESNAAMMRSGDKPADCRYTVIQDSRAIVDIYGAIMPRANMFSEWSGGVSCELLLKDIAYLANNDAITDVVFVIHSPGGEVTYVSETANAIRKLSQTKQTTAYISGLGCSAAYWLASACETIYANQTAIVGSIGVMSCYVDDSKQMEMIGLEEIEFISSQSPYKNASPTTSEGKKRIQQRVDALAQVFIENVAQNRGVSVDEVLKNFGQGDVFAGRDLLKAKKAKMIDFIGNFTDAMTLTDTEDVEDVEDIEPEDLEPSDNENKNKRKNNMAEKQETALSAAEKAEFEQMKKTLAQLQTADAEKTAALEKLQAKNDSLELEKLTNELKEVSKNWSGEKENHLTVMKGLVSAFGKDSKEFTAYVASQNAQAALIEASSLFEEVGTGRGGEEKSALEQLNEKAKVIQAAEKIPFENAFQKAVEENQSLYVKYQAESRGGK